MARSSDQGADDRGVERVVVTIDGLEELTEIREALDTIRDDIAWWINNHRDDEWLPVQPIAIIPAVSPIPASASSLPTSPSLSRPLLFKHGAMPAASQSQQATAPTEGHDDETQFCCDAPDLQWTGDPQFPGVACLNCGYIVADCGSVVMQPAPEADPDPEPKEQQRGLFADD